MALNTKIRGYSDDCTVLTCYAMIDVSKSTLYCYEHFFLLLCKKETTPKCCLSTAGFCIVKMTVQAGKIIIKVELNFDKLIANCGFTCKVQKRNHFGKTALDNIVIIT